jgi:linoleoyl-CoA desaturase
MYTAYHLIYSVAVPLYLHPLKHALTLVAIVYGVNGILFVLHFAINHMVPETEFPDEITTQRDWAKLQILTSCNYAPGSVLWNSFSGGLNHQIEHHVSSQLPLLQSILQTISQTLQ